MPRGQILFVSICLLTATFILKSIKNEEKLASNEGEIDDCGEKIGPGQKVIAYSYYEGPNRDERR